MRISIRQKNLELTAPLREYIEMKIVRTVERMLKDASASELPILDVEVERTTNHHRKGMVYRIGVNLSLGGQVLRAEALDEDVRAACDIVEEDLSRKILRLKGRKMSIMKRFARAAKKAMRFDSAARFWRKGRIREEGN